jgi:hypothetical protein
MSDLRVAARASARSGSASGLPGAEMLEDDERIGLALVLDAHAGLRRIVGDESSSSVICP